ncbi:MAG: diguanylate cyclase [Candidatus Aenigmatarchaeota archaeon]
MNYKKVFQNATDPMIFFDLNGKIMETNSSMEDLTGRKKDDLSGKHVKEFLDDYSQKELEDLTKDPKQRREITVIKDDGERKEMDVEINRFGNDMYFAVLRDVTKHKELAEKDPLTKIYNYRKFYDKLKEEIELSKRYGHDLSILIIDVDNFKEYNDTKGHVEGDKLLKKIASLLEKESRDVDIVCRYGGDEFGIILPETKSEGAEELVQRIRNLYENIGENITGLSIGIYEYNGEGSPEEIVDKADKKMYKDKKGKNMRNG